MELAKSGTKNKKNLLIVSVSFLRIARVLLGEPVLDILRKNHEVLIIGPHVNNASMQADFSGPNIHFFKLNLPTATHPLERTLDAVASIQRMHGYWFYHRHTDMAYYHQNAMSNAFQTGQLKRFSLLKALLYKLIALTGRWRFSWRMTDSLLGSLFRKSAEMDAIIAGYDNVTLIQSAVWGKQDTYLAWYARKKKLRTILIPYSTDQLFINGFLPCDYDAVCIQGAFEQDCATRLHSIPSHKQIPLGSAWFRTINKILQDRVEQTKELKTLDMRIILFAGHSIFPKESEYRALRHLEQAVAEGQLGQAKIIYRPVVVTQQDIQQITDDWCHSSHIEIQLPQMTIIGLDQYPTQSLKKEWIDYITQLQQVDMVVMSFVSSLAIDAVYLNKPVIAVLDDPTGKLSQTQIDLMFDANGKIPGLESIPFVQEIKELVPLMKQMLFHPQYFDTLRDSIVAAWDFPDENFSHRLAGVLN